jgi:hypothetical protein
LSSLAKWWHWWHHAGGRWSPDFHHQVPGRHGHFADFLFIWKWWGADPDPALSHFSSPIWEPQPSASAELTLQQGKFMYSHLLVPIDATDLSNVVVGKAVELARSLGARITFFHAQLNYNASYFGDAELVRVTSPDDFAYSFTGRARELLAKAESAARAKGVTCNSVTTVCTRRIRPLTRPRRSDLHGIAWPQQPFR